MLRFRPTALGAKGALFFGVVSLLFFATPYSNLFFLLLAFLGALAVVGVVAAGGNLRGLAAELTPPAPVAAGEPCPVAVRLRLPPRRRRFCIDVALALGDRRQRHQVGSVPVVVDGTQLDGHLAGLPRGVHAITAIWLRSRYPFGICTVERRVDVPGLELIVHPRPAEPGQARAGHAAGSNPTDPGTEQLAGLRPWRAGDAPAGIHWKATARRGEPIVKEREQAVGDEVLVVVDRRGDDAALEHSLADATAALFAAWAANRPVRLHSQGCELVHRAAQPQRLSMLRWLATAPALPLAAAPPSLPPSRRGTGP